MIWQWEEGLDDATCKTYKEMGAGIHVTGSCFASKLDKLVKEYGTYERLYTIGDVAMLLDGKFEENLERAKEIMFGDMSWL